MAVERSMISDLIFLLKLWFPSSKTRRHWNKSFLSSKKKINIPFLRKIFWETGNLPKTQNVPEMQTIIQKYFVICTTILLIAAMQHSLQGSSSHLKDKMTQLPTLFHHYSLMKTPGLEDCHCRIKKKGSLIHPLSMTHINTKQEAETRKSDTISMYALAIFRECYQFK